MKRCVLVFAITLFLVGLALCHSSKISLAGGWSIKLDRQDAGLTKGWSLQKFNATVHLPGALQAQGYGDKPNINTPWIGGSGVEKLDLPQYQKYWEYVSGDDYKHPFWLTPDRYYRGAAWFQRKITIPPEWAGKRIMLHLERCHWETTAFLDGRKVGSDSSLSTPHIYDLSRWAAPGEHRLTIRVVNDMIVNVGENAHSVSDHTQSNWNGIVGDIALIAEPAVSIKSVQLYPNVGNKTVLARIALQATDDVSVDGLLSLQATGAESLAIVQQKVSANHGLIYEIVYNMGEQPKLWDEFQPNLYSMTVSLKSSAGEDEKSVQFGMRDFKAVGTRFHINGRPIFLRGTLDCCVFPKTGYPPTDVASWARIFRTLKAHGLNHIRFHSWCPPEAAFNAADSAGFYLQVEGPFWVNQGATMGDGNPIDAFIYNEIDRILDEYGNHPSFCLLAYGNEPAGKHQKEFLGQLVLHCRARDSRHLYTSASGWPIIPESDYHSTPAPRLQQWGQGLDGILNGQSPRSDYDWREVVQRQSKPVIGHEIGQWCVYPNFDEMTKYTGYLKPKNFEIFYDLLKKNHMADQAHNFFMASGKLQALCYKAEIEAALRTPGYAGFQLLDIHDFPGQGTALVGVLDPFYESKPYIDAEQFNQFCGVTVPLARLPRRIFTNADIFVAPLEVSHFGPAPIRESKILWSIEDQNGVAIQKGDFVKTLAIDNCQQVGVVRMSLDKISAPQKLRLRVTVDNHGRNSWDFWVYPNEADIQPGDVIVANALSHPVLKKLEKGATVLLNLNGKIKKGRGAEVAVGFSPVFWNTAWTNDQAPHTLGILCDPKNALFADFPTEYYSNWQWWDVIKDSQAMILDEFVELRPDIQLIDTWFYARRLALLFEARIGKGKLMVTSIDFNRNLESRPAKKQLLKSLFDYMNSDAFSPAVEVSAQNIIKLYR